MEYYGKKSTGWHAAGLILSILLLLIFAGSFVLGVMAFGTGDFLDFGNTAVYPAGDEEILPKGAAAVVQRDLAPQQGMPAAYFDTEAEKIRIKYFYGEENVVYILTDEDSQNVSEVLPEQMKGCVVSYIPLLGGFLGWICTLEGVCICLALAMILLASMFHIAVGLNRRTKHNRRIRAWDMEDLDSVHAEEIAEEESMEAPAEEPEPAPEEEPEQFIGNCTMERTEDADGKTLMIFRGESIDVLRLTKVFRSAAEKRGAGNLAIEENYAEISELKLTVGEDDLLLMESLIGMLKERE